MEHLPAFAADAANPACRRSNRQRNQGYESREAYGDERALRDVSPHGGEIERLVWPEVGEKVQTDIEDREESAQAAKAVVIREVEKFAKGQAAKRDDK